MESPGDEDKGENLINGWKTIEDSKLTPRFQTVVVPGREMVPLTKRGYSFLMEKTETEEVNAHVTLAIDHLHYKIHSSSGDC